MRNSLKVSQSFLKKEMHPIISANRKSLKKIKTWIDEDTYKASVFNYGIPDHIKHFIDEELDNEVTYSDALLYLVSSLKKKVNYLEVGVSVGKNFFQVINYLQNSLIVGFDIEKINPTLEKYLVFIDKSEWNTMHGSLKTDKSSFSHYEYTPNQNQVSYLNGDVFDEVSWKALEGKQFNIIFSDALHSPEALLKEYEMICKYNLLDRDEFLLIWDDLGGNMSNTFNVIWNDLKLKYNLRDESKQIFLLNGWIGKNEYKHEIGIIMNFK